MSPAQKRNIGDDAYKAERARLLLAFGERLRTERERQNLSQESLAEVANVHRTHLGALERGRREPHLAMLLILANALRIPPGTLLEGLFVPIERKAPTHSKAGKLDTKPLGLARSSARTGRHQCCAHKLGQLAPKSRLPARECTSDTSRARNSLGAYSVDSGRWESVLETRVLGPHVPSNRLSQASRACSISHPRGFPE